MPYTTGSAADMAAVKTALVNACTSDGWTNQNDAGGDTVLSKSGIYVRVEATTTQRLELLGRTSLDSGGAPATVRIQPLGGDTSISFPITYHVFTFTAEVFLIINYSDKYLWLAFGQSDQPGLSGSGNWVAGISAEGVVDDGSNLFISSRFGNVAPNSYSRTCPGLFWQTEASLSGGDRATNMWVHNEIESSYPWSLGVGTNFSDEYPGIQYLTELLDTQPNDYNQESVLLPIRAYKRQPESKISQVVEVKNARHIRIDNYNDEQVITLGTDDWMIFPYFRRDTANRDGDNTEGIDHTGTFGWAIKKDN